MAREQALASGTLIIVETVLIIISIGSIHSNDSNNGNNSNNSNSKPQLQLTSTTCFRCNSQEKACPVIASGNAQHLGQFWHITCCQDFRQKARNFFTTYLQAQLCPLQQRHPGENYLPLLPQDACWSSMTIDMVGMTVRACTDCI